MNGLFVIKRSGDRVPVRFDAITRRLSVLATGTSEVRHALKKVDCAFVTGKIASSLTPGVSTSDIDRLAAETCAYMSRYDPEYMILAGRIAVSNLHKQRGIKTKKWTENVQDMMIVPDCNPLLSREVYEFVMANADALNAAINYENDYRYDYFAIKTLERGYLVQLGGKDGPRETPQEMLMRVCCGKYALDMERYLKGHRGLDAGNLERALSSYRHMSNMMYTNATPTLFNCGGPSGGTPSCYLLTMEDDSIDGIYSTLAKTAKLSKACGGIGISVTNIRASGSAIRGTNGISTGLVPMLRVFNDTARYVDQGGGKRKGAFAIYCEPWHSDIEDLVDLKRNDGKEEARARDMFYGLWIPDLFMKRVEEDQKWSLFCPTKVTKKDEKTGKILHLYDVWGEEFEKMYVDAENAGLANKTIKARDLWYRIVDNQISTGVPYMMYKDACNRKTNQSNLGTIRGSNLCTEIVQYTSSNEVAVCTLSSLSLPAFCNRENGGFFDHDSFFLVVYDLVIELNNILFTNRHVIPETEFSCENQMAIGLGVQGLADVFAILRMPFDSQRAKKLNREIFETLYFAALSSSCDLAKRTGKKYKSFEGSPASSGILQYDMWNEKPSFPKWDWEDLKSRIKKYGLSNSLLIAPMPTATTAQIMGNNECFEPFTSNIYARRVLAGEFVVINKHLMADLKKLGLYDEAMYEDLVREYGSVQNIERIPQDIKEIYKTVWEIKQKTIIDLAADRGPFVDQSQSLNIHICAPTRAKITAMHFYGWKKGLKTGMYYLRTKSAANAVQITISDQILQHDAPRKNISTSMYGVAESRLYTRNESKKSGVESTEDQAGSEVQEKCSLGNGGPDCESCSG